VSPQIRFLFYFQNAITKFIIWAQICNNIKNCSILLKSGDWIWVRKSGVASGWCLFLGEQRSKFYCLSALGEKFFVTLKCVHPFLAAPVIWRAFILTCRSDLCSWECGSYFFPMTSPQQTTNTRLYFIGDLIWILQKYKRVQSSIYKINLFSFSKWRNSHCLYFSFKKLQDIDLK